MLYPSAFRRKKSQERPPAPAAPAAPDPEAVEAALFGPRWAQGWWWIWWWKI